MGIVKYMTKSYAEARIYLSDFIRVMDIEKTVERVDYVMALHLLGEIHISEARPEDSKRAFTTAQIILERNPAVSEKLPVLEELISHRLQATEKSSRGGKGFFGRLTELTRLEDEVSPGDLTVGQKVDKILRTFVIVDD